MHCSLAASDSIMAHVADIDETPVRRRRASVVNLFKSAHTQWRLNWKGFVFHLTATAVLRHEIGG